MPGAATTEGAPADTGSNGHGELPVSEDAFVFHGGDEEDTRPDTCPIGCRHQKDELKGVTETYATAVVGGIPKIMQVIKTMEAPWTEPQLNTADTPTANHANHSLFLSCEKCMERSVCSFSCYQRNIERIPAGLLEKVLPHRVMKTPQEYYLHIALTGHVMATPRFSHIKRTGRELLNKQQQRQRAVGHHRSIGSDPSQDNDEGISGGHTAGRSVDAEREGMMMGEEGDSEVAIDMAGLDRALKRRNRNMHQ